MQRVDSRELGRSAGPLDLARTRGRSRRRGRNRGSMLIVALGVLMLLSVLAVTFVGLMKLELLASKNYVDGVKARLIAEGGLEQAVSELKARGGLEGVSSVDADWVYANGNYWLPIEESTLKFIPNPANLNGPQIPNPLYDPNKRCSYVGSLGRSYPNGNDRYKIQVIDAQSQFNLNNSFRAEGVYIRELEALGVAISQLNPRAKAAGINPIKDARYPKDNPTYFGAEAILQFRKSLEGGVFNSKYQLTEILPDDIHYKYLRDYVTTKSWFDPSAVSAWKGRGLDLTNRDPSNPDLPQSKGYGFSDVFVPTLAVGQTPVRRAPININLATQEVLAANLAGVAGRGVYMYFGGHSGKPIGLQMIDGTNPTYAWQQHKEIQEETDYTSYPVVVYIPPLGYTYGGAPAVTAPAKYANDQPSIAGAMAIAAKICARRRTPGGTGSGQEAQGPFKCFADWERWVDQNITNDFLSNPVPGSSGPAFPTPDTAPMFSGIDHSALVSPAVTDVRSSPRFRQWYYDCVRSLLKANFNPNGRASSLNPDQAINLEVDKGNLLFCGDDNAGPLHPENVSVNNCKTQWDTNTCEWCFGSKGVFEIIALGEVMGQDAVKDEAAGKPTNPYAQAKILTVVQIFDQVVHTSQRDFERNGQPNNPSPPGYPGGWGDDASIPPPGSGYRYGVVSWPFSKVLWDPRIGTPQVDHFRAMHDGGLDDSPTQPDALVFHGHNFEGHLALAPRIQLKGLNTSVTTFGTKLFELLFQDRRVRDPKSLSRIELNDAFVADTANSQAQNPNPGTPVTGQPTTGFAMPHPFFTPAASSGVATMTGPKGTVPRPVGCETTFDNNIWLFQQLLLPDGFHANEIRNLPLWYRASNRDSVTGVGSPEWPASSGGPEGSKQGDSGNPLDDTNKQNPGNCIATPTGGVEFWYKPEFDWFVREKKWPNGPGDPVVGFLAGPTQIPSENTTGTVDNRLCGYIATTNCTINPLVTDAGWGQAKLNGDPNGTGTRRPTRGTQMYVTRNSSGDLRVTRLYFEVVGPANSNAEEIPWVTGMDPKTGPDPKTQVRVGAKGVANTYMDLGATKAEYTWPPVEFAWIPSPWFDITYARVETWVPGNSAPICSWRAHEWHHVGIRWTDDTKKHPFTDDPAASIEIFLDGVKAASADPRQLGPHIPDGIVYTQNPPGNAGAMYRTVSTTKVPATNPPTGPDQWQTEIPRFVRLNQRGVQDKVKDRRPKDEIFVGGISRPEALTGGLFKYVTNGSATQPVSSPIIPSNGTVDDIRFYDGVTTNPKTGAFADRYEDHGIWTNEFDLSDRFDRSASLELANMQFTAYLPTTFGKALAKRAGAGSVVVSFYLLRTAQPGSTVASAAPLPNLPPNAGRSADHPCSFTPGIIGGTDAKPLWNWQLEFNDHYLVHAGGGAGTTYAFSGFNLTDDKGGPVYAFKGDRLVYCIEIFPARIATATSVVLSGDSIDASGFAVATPVLDDVSLVYFLPTSRVLLKERMWD